MKLATALFITILAALAVVAWSPVVTDVALAQQQVAQDQPKEVIPATLSSSSETPEKFRPLVRKWKYDTNQRFVSTFEVVSVRADGSATIKDYKVNGRDVPQATLTAMDGEKDTIRVRIKLGEGAWDLAYSTAFGGMLDGTFTPSGRAPIDGKFYAEK